MHICILSQICDFLRVPNAENTKIVYNPKAFKNFERLPQHTLKDVAEGCAPGPQTAGHRFLCCAYGSSHTALWSRYQYKKHRKGLSYVRSCTKSNIISLRKSNYLTGLPKEDSNLYCIKRYDYHHCHHCSAIFEQTGLTWTSPLNAVFLIALVQAVLITPENVLFIFIIKL